MRTDSYTLTAFQENTDYLRADETETTASSWANASRRGPGWREQTLGGIKARLA